MFVTKAFVILAFVFFIETASSASTNLLNFVSTFEGFYTNREQYERDSYDPGQSHNLLDVYMIPVDVPAFYPEVGDGISMRLELFHFSVKDNDVVRLQRYSLTDSPASYSVSLPEYLFGPGDHSYAFVNPC